MPSTNRTSSVGSQRPDEDIEDPTSSTHCSLSRAVLARKPEYVRPHRVRVKVGTWNVAACPGTDKDLASWFVEGKGLDSHVNSHLSDLSLKESGVINEDGTIDPIEISHKTNHNRVVDGSSASSRADSASVPHKSEFKPATALQEEDDRTPVKLVGGSDIGLYVLGLQEIVSLNLVTQSLYSDPAVVKKWQAAVEAALPPGYTLVASQQLFGLLMLIYASPEVAPTINNVSTVSVGTGLLGYMGNKGGVSTRVILGETTKLLFTNCHLASGHDFTNLERRCWDYTKIVGQTQFAPIDHGGVLDDEGDKIGDEHFAFWFGDLNFRLDGLPGEDIRRILTLHSRGEYDLSQKDTRFRLDEEGVIVIHNRDSSDGSSGGISIPSMSSRESSFDLGNDDEDSVQLPDPDDFVPDPHDDPASLQATLDSLLPHDQLRIMIKKRKAFHEGWREGPITFLPSYKYDVGTVGLFDSSEKQRAPSWCDRILFRTKTDLEAYQTKFADEIAAKKKDEDMKQRGIDAAVEDESVLFDYDPDEDSTPASIQSPTDAYDYEEYDDEGMDQDQGHVVTSEGAQDHIKLDIYTTHQRISSSDHKPVVAVFTLDYDAVVPELKAKIHAEVARELDRAENEGRPGITIVVDGYSDADESSHVGQEIDVTDGRGGVDFGNVSFMSEKQRSLTIANTGRVPATVSFVGKPSSSDESGEGTAQPDWLMLHLRAPDAEQDEEQVLESAKSIILEPGSTVAALLTLRVRSIPQLRALNQGAASLEDVLVLRVTDGRDHFLPIYATWLPSSFGRSIEELIRVPPRSGGIRGFANAHTTWSGGPIPPSLDVHGSSPAELYKLTSMLESLAERAIADENMLNDEQSKIPRDQPGWPFDSSTRSHLKVAGGDYALETADLLAALIEAVDTDADLASAFSPTLSALHRLELAAVAIILFLTSLADGILSPPLWAEIDAAVSSLGSTASSKTAAQLENDKTMVLDVLSQAPYHNISFVFLTAMLSKIAAELLPLSPEDAQSLIEDPSRAMNRRSGIGRMGLSLRGRKDSQSWFDEAAIQRRVAWEHRVAEIFGPVICRTGKEARTDIKDKERKAAEDKMIVLVEEFLRRGGA